MGYFCEYLLLQCGDWLKQISRVWEECTLFKELGRMLSILLAFLPGQISLHPHSMSCSAVYCSSLCVSLDAAGASRRERFHICPDWTWLGLSSLSYASLSFLWTFLTGSPYTRLFVFCCFWLTTQWENAFELLHHESTLGMCIFAARDAKPLAFRVQRKHSCVSGEQYVPPPSC